MAKRVQTRNRRSDSRISGEVRRLDDLREMAIDRLDDLRRMERRSDHRFSKMRAQMTEAQMDGESKRIDALLAASAANVGLANARAEMTAATLAERVDTSAKTLATQVEVTAKAAAQAVEATRLTLEGRIKPLEDARYVEAGRSGLSTPLLMSLVAFVSVLGAFVAQKLLTGGF
jgi:hypothetical protein